MHRSGWFSSSSSSSSLSDTWSNSFHMKLILSLCLFTSSSSFSLELLLCVCTLLTQILWCHVHLKNRFHFHSHKKWILWKCQANMRSFCWMSLRIVIENIQVLLHFVEDEWDSMFEMREMSFKIDVRGSKVGIWNFYQENFMWMRSLSFYFTSLLKSFSNGHRNRRI